MKKKLVVAVAVLFGLAVACTLRAQSSSTTFPLDKSPVTCSAVTAAEIELPFYTFICNGVYDTGNFTFQFNGNFKTVTLVSKSPSFAARGTLVLTDFTQPTPHYCPLVQRYVSGCPSGTQPGTFVFTWSATDAAGNLYSGSVAGAWENVQIMGGERAWYHPRLLTANLSFGEVIAATHCAGPCGS